MALLNRSGRSGKSLLVAQGPEPLAGRGRRRGPVDDGEGIVGAKRPAQPLLGGPIHQPGLVQKHRRHRRQEEECRTGTWSCRWGRQKGYCEGREAQ